MGRFISFSPNPALCKIIWELRGKFIGLSPKFVSKVPVRKEGINYGATTLIRFMMALSYGPLYHWCIIGEDMKNRMIPYLMIALMLGACSGGIGQNVGTDDPMKMSASALCFRYANSAKDPALEAAIDARKIDCTAILRDDPLYHNNRAAEEGTRSYIGATGGIP